MKNLAALGIVVVALAAVGWFIFSSRKTANTNVPVSLTKEETPMSSPQPSLTASPSEATTNRKTYSAPPPMTLDANKIYTATMVTSKGGITLTLFVKEAPVTVNNFVFLARAGFYDNTVFHRIMKGFMIQGGDPLGNGTGGPGYKFADEPITRDYIRGTIAMANSGPNTNGSQFFIVHETTNLPKQYVIFGAINASDSASLTTLDAIASAPVGQSAMGESSRPVEPVTLSSVTIEEK